MKDALFGTEIEFASAGDLPPARAAALVKNVIFAERRFGIIDPAPREWDEAPGNGGFLFNGARLYLDSGHIEYASAECRTLDDIVEQENAADALLLDAVESQELNRRLFFIKNNTDHLGSTFGYHENYAVRRSPLSLDMTVGLLPFLTTRQLYAGAGMTLTGQDDGSLPFHISQRAAFVTVDVSQRVRFGGRPIVNLRDEPLAEGAGLRRLHVIVGRRQPQRVRHGVEDRLDRVGRPTPGGRLGPGPCAAGAGAHATGDFKQSGRPVGRRADRRPAHGRPRRPADLSRSR